MYYTVSLVVPKESTHELHAQCYILLHDVTYKQLKVIIHYVYRFPQAITVVIMFYNRERVLTNT